MPIRAIIFDMGGVLLRTEDLSGRIKWEQRFQIERGELDRLVFDGKAAKLAGIGQANKFDVWNEVGQHFGINGTEIAQLEQDFWSGDHIDQRLLEYLRDLRTKYKTAILSNAWPEARRMLVEKYNVSPAFDLIMISAEEKIAKPDLYIYLRAAERLDVLPSECVFVDDFPENIYGARSAGMYAIQFMNTGQVINDLNSILAIDDNTSID